MPYFKRMASAYSLDEGTGIVGVDAQPLTTELDRNGSCTELCLCSDTVFKETGV